MRNLETLLNQARFSYYNGKPIMSDEAYDRLEEQLGVVNKVGYDVDSKDTRYPHAFPMYSLQKSYSSLENPNYGAEPVTVTPKLDGAAVSLQYIRGTLSIALTRGDGKQGLDITDNMRFLVPRHLLPFQGTPIVQITGEVVAPATIKNSRNYAAGALSLHDSDEFQKRDLTFVAYGVQPYPTDNFIEDMMYLNASGFETIIDSDYPMFPQDGNVWRIISNKAFEKLG